MGDAELDDGNAYECLQEDAKNDLRDTWQVTDYNRQSLDRIVRKGLSERDEKFFDTFGWEVVRVKYGHLQRTAFAQAGGEKSQAWIDNGPNQLYAALTYMGGAIRCKYLMDDLSDQGHVTALFEARSGSQLANRIVISSPDVTGTTNLGPWVNPRKLFARIGTSRHVQRS